MSSGTGRATRQHRDASSASTSTQPWQRNPTEIPRPGNNHLKPAPNPTSSPFNGRMRSNLNGTSNNRTRQATVLPSPGEPPPKRRKTNLNQDPRTESRYFTSEGATRSGVADGKKTAKKPTQYRTSGSPDPLDVIDDSSSDVVGHPFHEKPQAGPSRAPAQDGAGTKRLKEKVKQRPDFGILGDPIADEPEVIEDDESTGEDRNGAKSVHEVVDVDASSDIESASGFDDPNEPGPAPRSPPSKTSVLGIPPGTVNHHRGFFESKEVQAPSKTPAFVKINGVRTRSLSQFGGAPPMAPLEPTVEPPLRTVNLKVASMKPKSGKSANSQLRVFPEKPTDPERATEGAIRVPAVPSAKWGRHAPTVDALPLCAWSLGCQLMGSENEEPDPSYWLDHVSSKTARSPSKLLVKGQCPSKHVLKTWEFRLDREFDYYEFTNRDCMKEGDMAVIQLTTTKGPTLVSANPPSFVPGSKRAPGKVTLRFLTRHAKWANTDAYAALLRLLGREIAERGELRGVAATALWQQTTIAAQHSLADTDTPTSLRPMTRASVNVEPRNGSKARPASTESPPPGVEAGTTEVESVSAGRSVDGPTGVASRRPTRQSARLVPRSPSRDPDELILVFPPSGTGAVNITGADLKRLSPGQYLNDTLIEFGLRLCLYELKEKRPELAEQVHVFNSFFFKKLYNAKDPEEGYKSVRKWTLKVDIFQKKYIIIPINENFHWYLAIIENPSYMLQPPPQETPSIVKMTRKRKRESEATDDVPVGQEGSANPDEDAMSHLSPEAPLDQRTKDTQSDAECEEVDAMMRTAKISASDPVEGASPKAMDTGDDFPRPTPMVVEQPRESSPLQSQDLLYPDISDEAMDVDIECAGATETIHQPTPSSDVTISDVAAAPDPVVNTADVVPDDAKDARSSTADDDEPREDLVQDPDSKPDTVIFTFDSLNGRHPKVGNTLSKYLRFEARDKRKMDLEKDTRMSIYNNTKSPAQKNFSDCGVYVLHFAERFMNDPEGISELCKRRPRVGWYGEGDVGDLRGDLKKKTLKLSDEWKKSRPGVEKTPEQQAGVEEAATAKTNEPQVVEVSDDDCELVGVSTKASTSRKAKASGKSRKPPVSAAERIR